MANSKISALTELTVGNVAASTDFLPIVDTSATETKKVTPASVLTDALGQASSLAWTAPTAITVSSATTALRVTQTGAGDVLRIEDSANPDSSPLIINADGRMIQNHTALVGIGGISTQHRQVHGYAAVGVATENMTTWVASNLASVFSFAKSRGTAVSDFTVVQNNDQLGTIQFYGSDGTQFVQGASITVNVDGTPGANDMPGRIIFSTTADGASSPTERMRINASGNLGVGSDAGAASVFMIAKNITGATTTYGVRQIGTIQSDVTSSVFSILSSPATLAAAFTLTNLFHMHASQGVIGAGSAITNQYGFHASSNLTGATNNYGFYSDVPSGTGRWNVYANGTARNYFAGGVEPLAGVTTQAAGFVNISAAAGVPTGIPTNPTGNVPLYYDTTNNKLYVYNAGWKSTAALT